MKVFDPKNGIIPYSEKEVEELRVIHGAYALMRRGYSFTEWAYKSAKEVDAKLSEIIEAETAAKAKAKAKKEPAFDKKKFLDWARADTRYTAYTERLKTLTEEERKNLNETEGKKLFAELKKDFLAKAA